MYNGGRFRCSCFGNIVATCCRGRVPGCARLCAPAHYHVWALGELTYGTHSTHGLHACPFDLLSTPATRATPRSNVGRDAKVIPLSAPCNGLHHRLPRARGRLCDARELGPTPVGHGEKPGSAATSAWASWRAPSTAEGVGAVYDRAKSGPPPEKGAQCFSSQLYPACNGRMEYTSIPYPHGA